MAPADAKAVLFAKVLFEISITPPNAAKAPPEDLPILSVKLLFWMIPRELYTLNGAPSLL